ncbi:23S rRNA (guanosine-2'-O-)-methyltransferase RlmB [bioreactor metagenome]|uniref:23S rRNA (Guanosine-2'-O-)-methyltransferase RlmB n=2 Tax=root TaxID=1 RepID=A0A645IBU9_9ZZZZ
MREKCDQVVSIPMVGKLNSLNASVAGGILMYEVMKGRILKSDK